MSNLFRKEKGANMTIGTMVRIMIMLVVVAIVIMGFPSISRAPESLDFAQISKINSDEFLKNCNDKKIECTPEEQAMFDEYLKIKDCDYYQNCNDEEENEWNNFKLDYFEKDEIELDETLISKINSNSILDNSDYDLNEFYNSLNSYEKRTYDRLKEIKIGSLVGFREDGIQYLETKSKENGINSIFAFYVIHRESRGDKNAISSTGCAGLFQFCYNTAHVDYKEFFGDSGQYCKNRDLTTCADDLRFNPELAISAGTKYLGSLSQKFNNNMILILTAYNAGSGIANKCVSVPDNNYYTCVLSETDTYYTQNYQNTKKDDELKGYIDEIAFNYEKSKSSSIS